MGTRGTDAFLGAQRATVHGHSLRGHRQPTAASRSGPEPLRPWAPGRWPLRRAMGRAKSNCKQQPRSEEERLTRIQAHGRGSPSVSTSLGLQARPPVSGPQFPPIWPWPLPASLTLEAIPCDRPKHPPCHALPLWPRRRTLGFSLGPSILRTVHAPSASAPTPLGRWP